MRISIVFFALSLISVQAFAQKQVKEWLDKNGWLTSEGNGKAVRYRIGRQNDAGRLEGSITEYSLDNQKLVTGNMLNNEKNGLFEYYYPNSKLQSRGNYQDGQRVGKWEEWYANGQLREQGSYHEGLNERESREPWKGYIIESFWDSTGVQLVKNGNGVFYSVHQNGKIYEKGQYLNGRRSGDWQIFGEDGRLENKEQYSVNGLEKGIFYEIEGRIYEYSAETFEVLPEFPGETKALARFLSKKIKYPKEARIRRVAGTVFTGFVIEPDGTVSGVEVLRGIGGGCDEEAVRVISIMPQWMPGRQRGRAVSVRYSIPIKFYFQ